MPLSLLAGGWEERRRQVPLLDTQVALLSQLFSHIMLAHYVTESCRGAWERGCGTPTQVPLHTPSRGSIPVPSAPLRGGERGKSEVKDQRLKISGIQGLTQVNDHSVRVVVFEVRDGLCEQRDDLPLVGGREGRGEAKRACSDFLPFTLSSPLSPSLLPSVPH